MLHVASKKRISSKILSPALFLPLASKHQTGTRLVNGLFIFVLYVAPKKRVSSKNRAFCLVLSYYEAFFLTSCVFDLFFRTPTVSSVSDFQLFDFQKKYFNNVHSGKSPRTKSPRRCSFFSLISLGTMKVFVGNSECREAFVNVIRYKYYRLFCYNGTRNPSPTVFIRGAKDADLPQSRLSFIIQPNRCGRCLASNGTPCTFSGRHSSTSPGLHSGHDAFESCTLCSR